MTADLDLCTPVSQFLPFDSEGEAVQLANGTTYGLAAGLWTRDVNRAHRIARSLDAGTVWVNTYKVMHWALPFGGHKLSGSGTANGSDEVRNWMQPKSVWMKLG